jgi:hypothetical protein
MADEEKTGLSRKGSEVAFLEQPHAKLPEGPGGRKEKSEGDQTLQQNCDDLLEEMRRRQNQYGEIINKIKKGEGRLFLVKCKTQKGKEYYFLARYNSDNFDKTLQEQAVFGTKPDPCGDTDYKDFQKIENFEKLWNPMMEFTMLRNEKVYTLRFGNKQFKYEEFKKNIIPIDEAFMYENIKLSSNNESSIVGYTPPQEEQPPPIPRAPSEIPDDLVEEEVVHEIITPPITPIPSEEFKDVEEDDGTHVSDIELEPESDTVGGKKKKKKRRKKRSRSQKKRRRRRNSTKKN